MTGGSIRRIRSVLLFDVPIRQKFWVFGTSTGVWVALIGALAVLGTNDPFYRMLLVAACSVMLVALVAFSVLISRSLTRPLADLARRIGELARNEALPATPTNGATDELEALFLQTNRVLDAMQEVRAFKKVIEDDDRSQDVFLRLGREFGRLGLPTHAIHEVTSGGSRMRTALCSGGLADGACSLDVFVDASLCRARKTGGVVSSADYPDVCRQFTRQGCGHVCVPVTIGGATGAVVQLVFEDAAALQEASATVERARRFIDEARPVIEARRLMDALRESSVRDSLTGLHNRRFLEEAVERLLAGVKRRKATLGVLMCDLDYFKEVNDNHGHDAGDAILKETARRIAAAVRANDVVVRYGGEEFLVLLEDVVVESPLVVAERIRASLESNPFQVGVDAVRKTISIGVAEYPTDGTSFWQIVKFADVAMYRAKEGGRNRVVRFTPDMWTSKEY